MTGGEVVDKVDKDVFSAKAGGMDCLLRKEILVPISIWVCEEIGGLAFPLREMQQ